MGILSTIFKGILGGVSAKAKAKADAKLSKEQIAQQGLESRKTAGFAADTEWYYKQKDQEDKRQGFKNYATFNSLDRFAPQYVEQAPPPLPTKPTP